MRKYLRGICHKELARVERLIGAWKDPFDADFYAFAGEKDDRGVRVFTKLKEGNEYTPSIRSQLRSFYRRVVLKEDSIMLEYLGKSVPLTGDAIQFGYTTEHWNGPRHH
jgi:hypothetical protein